MSTKEITTEEIADSIEKSREQIEQSENIIKNAEALLKAVQENWQKQNKELFNMDEARMQKIIEKASPDMESELMHDPLSVLERQLMTRQPSEELELLANVIREDLAEQTVMPSLFNGQKTEQQKHRSVRQSRTVNTKI